MQTAVNVVSKTVLIHDLAPEVIVGRQSRIKAIRGGNATALIFAKGDNGVLGVIREKAGAHSGWDRIELTRENETVFAFDLWQDPASERFRLAVAMRDPESKKTLIRLTAFIDDPGRVNWAELLNDTATNKLWVPNPNQEVQRLVVGREHLLWGGAEPGADARYHYFQDKDQQVKDFELPEHGITILDLALGNRGGSEVVFLFYETRGGRVVAFQGFPQARFGGKSLKERFNCGQDQINAIAVFRCGDNDILFAGGSRLHTFDVNSGQNPGMTLELKEGEMIHQLESAQEGEYQTLIIGLTDTGQHRLLLEMSRKPQEGKDAAQWSRPVVIGRGLTNLSLMRGEKGFFNQRLFGVTPADELVCLQRTARHLLWSRKSVVLDDAGRLRTSPAFNSIVAFDGLEDLMVEEMDAAKPGEPIPEHTIRLWASRPVRLKVDGENYHCSPEQYIDLKARPYLNILLEADDILAPLLLVEATFLSKTAVVDLAVPVVGKLEGMQSGQQFKEDKILGPLVKAEPELSAENLEQLVGVVRSLLDIRASLMDRLEACIQEKAPMEGARYALGDLPIIPEGSKVYSHSLDQPPLVVPETPLEFTGKILVGGLMGGVAGGMVGGAVGGMAAVAVAAKTGAAVALTGAALGPPGWIFAGIAIGATVAISAILLMSEDGPVTAPITIKLIPNHEKSQWELQINDGQEAVVTPFHTPDDALGLLRVALGEMGITGPALQQWVDTPIPFERMAHFTETVEEVLAALFTRLPEVVREVEDFDILEGVRRALESGLPSEFNKPLSDLLKDHVLQHGMEEPDDPDDPLKRRGPKICRSRCCNPISRWLMDRLQWYALDPLMSALDAMVAAVPVDSKIMAAVDRLMPPDGAVLFPADGEQMQKLVESVQKGKASIADFLKLACTSDLGPYLTDMNKKLFELLKDMSIFQESATLDKEVKDIFFLSALYQDKFAPHFSRSKELTLKRSCVLSAAGYLPDNVPLPNVDLDPSGHKKWWDNLPEGFSDATSVLFRLLRGCCTFRISRNMLLRDEFDPDHEDPTKNKAMYWLALDRFVAFLTLACIAADKIFCTKKSMEKTKIEIGNLAAMPALSFFTTIYILWMRRKNIQVAIDMIDGNNRGIHTINDIDPDDFGPEQCRTLRNIPKKTAFGNAVVTFLTFVCNSGVMGYKGYLDKELKIKPSHLPVWFFQALSLIPISAYLFKHPGESGVRLSIKARSGALVLAALTGALVDPIVKIGFKWD